MGTVRAALKNPRRWSHGRPPPAGGSCDSFALNCCVPKTSEFAVGGNVRVAAVAALLIALMPMSARAQTLHGVGNTTCSQFLRAARMSDMLYHQASSWLLGYVSGMNAALASNGAPAAAVNLSNDQIAKSAGDYCEANPAKTIANAAAEWYPSLPRQAAAPIVQPAAPRTYEHLNRPFARPSENKR